MFDDPTLTFLLSARTSRSPSVKKSLLCSIRYNSRTVTDGLKVTDIAAQTTCIPTFSIVLVAGNASTYDVGVSITTTHSEVIVVVECLCASTSSFCQSDSWPADIDEMTDMYDNQNLLDQLIPSRPITRRSGPPAKRLTRRLDCSSTFQRRRCGHVNRRH